MIKIKKEDTIVDILKKINKDDSKKVILEFPFGHPVLYNHLSLKIIKVKTNKKQLVILSNDRTSKKIGEGLGIKYGKNHSENKYVSLNQKILKDNYTFWEYAVIEFKLFFGLIKGNILGIKKVNKIYYERNKFSSNYKNILIVFIILLFSIIGILLYVYSFTINKTTITITPEILVKLKSKNFNYVEYYEKTGSGGSIIKRKPIFNNEIRLEKISKKVVIRKKYSTTGIIQDEKDIAKGKAVLQNFLFEKIYLKKKTVFKTKNGILFYIKDDVGIQSATKQDDNSISPGETKVTLYGMLKLENGKYAGKKANINPGELLLIPKLKENKTKIFAKSISKFSGGSTNFTHYLTKDDLINAKKFFNIELKKEANYEIKKIVSEKNRNNGIKIDILPVDGIYKYYNKKVNVPDYLKVGDKIKNFEISGEITISSYLYEKSLVIGKLNSLIKKYNISGHEKIEQVNTDSLRLSHVITRNDFQRLNGRYNYMQKLSKPLRVKATTEISYLVTKKFTKSDEFLNRLKYMILGLDEKEAEKILINNDSINNIKIKVEPFFLKNISKNINNIYFKIEE